jgi:hypothetical protein
MIQGNSGTFPRNNMFNMPGNGFPETFGILLGIENVRDP